MAQRDYYEILGVDRSADAATLKRAYRRLAMKHHPDRNPDDKQGEERFKEVQAAWDVLGDAKKRAAYDRFGHAGVSSSAAGGAGGGGASAGGFGDFNTVFEDVFSDFFGGGGGGRGARSEASHRRGADLGYRVELSLEEAAAGISRELKFPATAACDACGGSGARRGSRPVACPNCRGEGKVRIQQGFFSLSQTCPACHGAGKRIANPCPACRGSGQQQKERRLAVKIPAGIEHGARIRLRGEGEAGANGGAPGDLFVEVSVRRHPFFTRDGNNLLCEAHIDMTTAALGGAVELPCLGGGRVTLKIPAGTQPGQQFRVAGKGVRAMRGSRQPGDLLCRVLVEIPVRLSEKQRALLQTFDDALQGKRSQHSPHHASWLDKVKGFFGAGPA